MSCTPGAARPAPRGTWEVEKIFVCCSASQKDQNFKFSPVELGWLEALIHRCSSRAGRGQEGWQCPTAACHSAPSHGHPSLYQLQDGHRGQLHTWLRPQDLARKGQSITINGQAQAPCSMPGGAPAAEQDPKPGWAARHSCKGQEGKPKPQEEAQSCHVAELLKRCLVRDVPPAQRARELPAGSGGSIACRGKAGPACKDVSSNKSLRLAGGEVLMATSPWQEVLPLAGQLTSVWPKHGEPSEW